MRVLFSIHLNIKLWMRVGAQYSRGWHESLQLADFPRSINIRRACKMIFTLIAASTVWGRDEFY
jgi:hypothetical protein